MSLPLLSLADDLVQPGSPEIDALAPLVRNSWKIESGEWNFTADGLTGAGNSKIVFQKSFKPPFRLTFDIEVLDGTRPRVHVGRFWFGNEGFSRVFSLYPDNSEARKMPYFTNKKYHVQIDVTAKEIQALVDGELIDRRPTGMNEIPPLAFAGGDGFSPGSTRYSKIRISALPVDAKNVAQADR